MMNERRKPFPAPNPHRRPSFVFKTLSEEHLGEFNLVRVFAGKLTTGQDVLNVTRRNAERLGNMYFLRGKERADTTEIGAGDIGGLLKLKDTHTNDTLADKSRFVSFRANCFCRAAGQRGNYRQKTKATKTKSASGLRNSTRKISPLPINFTATSSSRSSRQWAIFRSKLFSRT